MVIPDRTRRRWALAALFLAPAALLCLAPVAYALGLELWFSVSDAAPGTDGRFIGLANFQALAGLDGFWQMLQNTALYTVSSTLLKLAFGLAMALALPMTFPYRAELVGLVAGIVLVTLVVQGGTVGPLARRLLAIGVQPKPAGPDVKPG